MRFLMHLALWFCAILITTLLLTTIPRLLGIYLGGLPSAIVVFGVLSAVFPLRKKINAYCDKNANKKIYERLVKEREQEQSEA